MSPSTTWTADSPLYDFIDVFSSTFGCSRSQRGRLALLGFNLYQHLDREPLLSDLNGPTITSFLDTLYYICGWSAKKHNLYRQQLLAMWRLAWAYGAIPAPPDSPCIPTIRS